MKYIDIVDRSRTNKTYRKENLEDLQVIAKSMFDDNNTYKEIGERVNRSDRTIYYWKKKFGWQRSKINKYREGFIIKRKEAKEHYKNGW